jgi:ABC-type amino acid transport system permease subunit
MGLAATAGLRAGALRAAGFRAGALRAEVFFAVVLRAGAFFLAAPVLRAVLRTARAVARPVLRAVRAAFLTVLRGLAFLVVLRFFPLVFVAMASAPICFVTDLDRSNGPSLNDSRFHWPRLAVPPGESIVFFIIR